MIDDLDGGQALGILSCVRLVSLSEAVQCVNLPLKQFILEIPELSITFFPSVDLR